MEMKDKVAVYLSAHQKFFAQDKILEIKEKLENLSEEKLLIVTSVDVKDPIMMLLISIFAGSLGVDRFMLGDKGLGIAKLITLGGCGIWTIIDLFSIYGRTRQTNYNKISQFLI
ncbi:MAG: TM2 domain-containing protein [Elusimicrobiota bacterium]|jgi:TM2 domain-containing membrane protein YozV|nr:TM2 domain-containing protein [Elusimicrobiota bacterium]